MSAIKFRKRLTKFKIIITLPEKFGSKGFITVVKVIKIWRSSSESNKLRYVYPIWGTPGDIAIQKREIDYTKFKIVLFIINFGGNCNIRYTYIQIHKKVPRNRKNLLYLIGVHQALSQLAFWFKRRSRWLLWQQCWFPIWTILANFDLQVTTTPSAKFPINWTFSSGVEIQNRIQDAVVAVNINIW